MKKNICSIDKIVENNLCAGCGACYCVCASDAIRMETTSIGRILPRIDAAKCSRCGLCFRVCPGTDVGASRTFDEAPIASFIGRCADEIVFQNAQSGGMVSATLIWLFENLKIDAAVVCRMDEAASPANKARIITSVGDVYASQKSVYSPVDLLSVLKNAEQYGSIAVVGLPCHLEGIKKLKSVFPKRFENVKYLLGLICDRALSEAANDYLCSLTSFTPEQKKKIVYRDKTSNYYFAPVSVYSEGKRELIRSSVRMSIKEIFTNPRCRMCGDKLNVYADVVYGDPWGLIPVGQQEGESVAIARTSEGTDLLQEMKTNGVCRLKEIEYQKIADGQRFGKRKAKIAEASAAYRALGFELPTDGAKTDQRSDVRYKTTLKRVQDYLRLERLDRPMILKIVGMRMKWVFLKLAVVRWAKKLIKR